MNRKSRQDEAYDRIEKDILDNDTLSPKQRRDALREAEYEIYGDPQEEARRMAEMDGYSKYM